MVPGYRFWGGPIALQCSVHISKDSCNTKMVFNHFDCDSYDLFPTAMLDYQRVCNDAHRGFQESHATSRSPKSMDSTPESCSSNQHTLS